MSYSCSKTKRFRLLLQCFVILEHVGTGCIYIPTQNNKHKECLRSLQCRSLISFIFYENHKSKNLCVYLRFLSRPLNNKKNVFLNYARMFEKILVHQQNTIFVATICESLIKSKRMNFLTIGKRFEFAK